MGCWDVFCFICGNTCHSVIYDLDYFKEEMAKSYSKYPNDQIKILHENKNILTNLIMKHITLWLQIQLYAWKYIFSISDYK